MTCFWTIVMLMTDQPEQGWGALLLGTGVAPWNWHQKMSHLNLLNPMVRLQWAPESNIGDMLPACGIFRPKQEKCEKKTPTCYQGRSIQWHHQRITELWMLMGLTSRENLWLLVKIQHSVIYKDYSKEFCVHFPAHWVTLAIQMKLGFVCFWNNWMCMLDIEAIQMLLHGACQWTHIFYDWSTHSLKLNALISLSVISSFL